MQAAVLKFFRAVKEYERREDKKCGHKSGIANIQLKTR